MHIFNFFFLVVLFAILFTLRCNHFWVAWALKDWSIKPCEVENREFYLNAHNRARTLSTDAANSFACMLCPQIFDCTWMQTTHANASPQELRLRGSCSLCNTRCTRCTRVVALSTWSIASFEKQSRCFTGGRFVIGDHAVFYCVGGCPSSLQANTHSLWMLRLTHPWT